MLRDQCLQSILPLLWIQKCCPQDRGIDTNHIASIWHRIEICKLCKLCMGWCLPFLQLDSHFVELHLVDEHSGIIIVTLSSIVAFSILLWTVVAFAIIIRIFCGKPATVRGIVVRQTSATFFGRCMLTEFRLARFLIFISVF